MKDKDCDKKYPCEEDGCQQCCDHSDKTTHCCLICGASLEASDFGDEDYGADR